MPAIMEKHARRPICSGCRVARIRAHQHAGHIRVKVTGRLTASDVGRLEQACAPALTSGNVMLDIDVSRVTQSDDTAALIMRHMAERGAHIVESSSARRRGVHHT